MKQIYLRLLLAISLLWSFTSVANESSIQPSNSAINSSTHSSDFSWDIAVAVDIVNDSFHLKGSDQQDSEDFLNISILLDLYYRGFFIQSNKHRYSSYIDGVEVGYELEVNDDYEIDLIAKVYMQGFSETNAGSRHEDDDEGKIEELTGISERKYVSSQGVRYMRYLPNAAYWVDVAADIIDGYHHGWVVDSFYSHIFQHRNWDINLGAGVSFFSSNMNDYYFSVKPKEILDSRPVYKAGAGYRFQFEAYVQRPISESWGFSGGITFSHFSSSIDKSPLVKRQNTIRAQAGIKYVF